MRKNNMLCSLLDLSVADREHGTVARARSREPWPHRRLALAAVLGFVISAGPVVCAESILIPNASFEFPATSFVEPRIDFWQKAPKPFWYDESGGFLWDQLAGVFANVAPTNSAYIDNAHGTQGLYLFALPQNFVYQESGPTNEFQATFEAGKSYDLTVGVIGGGGGMTNGVSMQLGLYFRDASSNMVTVASTNLTFTLEQFPNTTHYIDYTVHVPVVAAGDAWAGKPIGIVLMSTVDPALAGGYWDLDHVRLTASGAGPELSPAWGAGQFQLTVRGDAGAVYEVLASPSVPLPTANWTPVATLTNTSGTVSFLDPSTNLTARFYQVRTVR
jgi:hypothetical protein